MVGCFHNRHTSSCLGGWYCSMPLMTILFQQPVLQLLAVETLVGRHLSSQSQLSFSTPCNSLVLQKNQEEWQEPELFFRLLSAP